MKPTRLQASNFLSWKELDYYFENRVVALSGTNKTEEDQGSNGTGKSSILQMIYFAYTGNNLRGVLDKKLIRKGESEGVVVLTTYCPKRDQYLCIERSIFKKGSSKLSISINDNAVSVATVQDGNKFILNWLSISPEDLKSYYLICKEVYKSFFKSSNTEKLALISRFINFSRIDLCKNVINSKVVKLNEEKLVIEREMHGLEGKLEVYENQLVEEENRDIEEEKKKKIEQLQSKIESHKSSIVEIEEKIEIAKKEIVSLEEKIEDETSQLKKFEKRLKEAPILDEVKETLETILKELKTLKEEQMRYQKEQEELENKRNEIKKELRLISVNLSGKIICPKCHYEFLTLKNTTLEDELKKKEELNEKDKKLAKEELKIDETLKEYGEVISECIGIKSETEKEEEEVKEIRRKIDSEISKVKKNIDISKYEIERIKKQNLSRLEEITDKEEKIEEIKKDIEEIKKSKIEIDVKKYEDLINSTSKEIEKSNEKVLKSSEKIFKLQEWTNKFQQFKMYLASEQIKNIQSLTNDILQKEKSDLRILIEAFKLTSTGELREEITPYVLRDEPESFWYYSGGERARVEIALIIAIQTMINSTNEYGGLELLFIDEVTEGLSESGLYNVVEALSFINYPIFIATQADNQNVKCAALKVEKVNGISKLI